MPQRTEPEPPATAGLPALRLAMLADDLTGACDAAAAFAARGLRTQVGLTQDAAPAPGCEVWSRSSESRDIPAAQLAATLQQHLDHAPAARQQFKKIDSVFRGNTFAEIALVARAASPRLVLVAPAFPAAGRIVREGVLHVRDVRGEQRVPLVAELHKAGVVCDPLRAATSVEAVAQALQECVAHGPRILLCDAETQHDLDSLVAAAEALAEPPLWIGSAGLAHALAAHWRPQGLPHALQQRDAADVALFFIGSDHPVTQRQRAQLERSHAGNVAVRVHEVPRDAAGTAAVTQAMAILDPGRIACVFVTGGDTATTVLRALGVESLEIVGEFATGLPVATAVGGPLDGVPLILKSGGFGSDDVLCRIAERFSAAPVLMEGSMQ